MPDQNIETIMQECLRRLEAGETVDTILHDFPQQAAEIGPLLAVAVGLRRWQAPSLGETARNVALSRALAALPVAVPTNPTRRGLLGRMRLQPVLLLALLLMFVLGGFGGSVAIAQASLPGDVLYGLKRTSEQARLQIATSHEQRATLYLTFASRRVNELVQLEAAQRVPPSNIVDDLQQDYDQCRAEISQAGPSVQHPLIVQYQADVQTQSQALTAALPVASSAARAIMTQAQTVNNGAATRLQLTPSPTLPATATSAVATPAASLDTSLPAEMTASPTTTHADATSIPTLTPTLRSTSTPTGPSATTRADATSTLTLTPTLRSTSTPTGPQARHSTATPSTSTLTPTAQLTSTLTPTGPPTQHSTATPSTSTLTPTLRPTLRPTPTGLPPRRLTATPSTLTLTPTLQPTLRPTPTDRPARRSTATPTSARRSTATPTSTSPPPARSKLPTTGTTATPGKLLPTLEPKRVHRLLLILRADRLSQLISSDVW
ncbi:MAG: hypothetical protein H0X37_09795 [Herpetosiphonaceae bacterium]|nr:hypothetical protein [Herpetosiphonaceae bacterium]